MSFFAHMHTWPNYHEFVCFGLVRLTDTKTWATQAGSLPEHPGTTSHSDDNMNPASWGLKSDARAHTHTGLKRTSFGSHPPETGHDQQTRWR